MGGVLVEGDSNLARRGERDVASTFLTLRRGVLLVQEVDQSSPHSECPAVPPPDGHELRLDERVLCEPRPAACKLFAAFADPFEVGAHVAEVGADVREVEILPSLLVAAVAAVAAPGARVDLRDFERSISA